MKEIPKIRAIYQQDIATSEVVIFELDFSTKTFIDINCEECFYHLEDVLRDEDFMLFELEYDEDDDCNYCHPINRQYLMEIING